MQPSTGRCTQMPLYIYRYMFAACLLLRRFRSNYPVLNFQGTHGFPVQFPDSLSCPPDSAGFLDSGTQYQFVPRYLDGNHVMVLAPRMARFACPWCFLDHQFHGFQAHAGSFVIKVAHADEAVCVSIKQFFGSGHTRSQCESRFHSCTTLEQPIGGQDLWFGPAEELSWLDAGNGPWRRGRGLHN